VDKARDTFNEDYFLRGKETGVSNYENYIWRPDLTVPACQSIINALDARKGDRILDFGCARGYYVRALRQLGLKAYGYDVSAWAIEQADEVVKDFVSNSFPGAGYDFILCKDVMEHIPTPELEEVIEAIARMTWKCALVVVPLTAEPDGAYIYPRDNDDATHIQRRNMDGWLQLFERVIDGRIGDADYLISGSYRMKGLKDVASVFPRSTGFFFIRRR